MNKRFVAYRDGVLLYSSGEVLETEKAIVEVLYKDQQSAEKIFFAELKGTVFCAHGHTIEEAIEEAVYKSNGSKLTEEEKTKYRNPDFKFSVSLFRRITGACNLGIDSWLKDRGLDRSIKMTLAEFEKAGGGQWADDLESKINECGTNGD